MKSIITISLSFLVLLQGVGIGVSDILVMDELVEHAKYHAETHGDNFFNFFEKHYGSLKAEHQKNDKEEKSDHEKLPFQHNSSNHLMTDVVLVTFEVPLSKSIIPSSTTSNFHYKNLYSFIKKPSIFQPPKLA